LNKWGYIIVNPETNETSKEFVYAGGDIVTGSATVIQAMGAGRIAADAIHKKLSSMNEKQIS
jgi:glutamate synthase (NADPH/NADH) small chain